MYKYLKDVELFDYEYWYDDFSNDFIKRKREMLDEEKLEKMDIKNIENFFEKEKLKKH
jgi:hypothetical protein